MTELIYSVPNGKYYISSSDIQFHLGWVPINGVRTIIGISQKKYRNDSIIFTVQTNKQNQYGYIKVESRTFSTIGYLTFNEKINTPDKLIISPNLDDVNNQTFLFSTDGRIILPLKNPIISLINNKSTIIIDPDFKKFKWHFSTFSPSQDGLKNMWNIDPYHYSVNPEDAEEFFYQDNKGNCSSSLSRHNCSSNETELRFQPGSLSRNPETYCLRTKFDENYKKFLL